MRSEIDALVRVVHANMQLLRGTRLRNDSLGFVPVEREIRDEFVVVLQFDHGIHVLQLAQRPDQNHCTQLREELSVQLGLLHPLENGEKALHHVQRMELVLDHVVESDQLLRQTDENILRANLGEEDGVLRFKADRVTHCKMRGGVQQPENGLLLLSLVFEVRMAFIVSLRLVPKRQSYR